MTLVDLNKDREAIDMIHQILSKTLPDKWLRRYLVQLNFLENGRDLNYFKADLGRLERLSWLYSQPEDDWIRYLKILNWYDLTTKPILAIVNQDSELPISLENHLNWTLLLISYWNQDFARVQKLLNLTVDHPMHEEYRNRYLWENR